MNGAATRRSLFEPSCGKLAPLTNCLAEGIASAQQCRMGAAGVAISFEDCQCRSLTALLMQPGVSRRCVSRGCDLVCRSRSPRITSDLINRRGGHMQDFSSYMPHWWSWVAQIKVFIGPLAIGAFWTKA